MSSGSDGELVLRVGTAPHGGPPGRSAHDVLDPPTAHPHAGSPPLPRPGPSGAPVRIVKPDPSGGGVVTAAVLVSAVESLLTTELTAAGVDVVCRQIVELLPVHGVAVTVAVGPGSRVLVGASDATARHLELAQLTAGVGPCTEATRTGQAVVVEDLLAALDRWPGLGEQLPAAGIGSVVANALLVGPITIGSMDVYRRDRHLWTAGELADVAEAARVLGLGLAAVQVLEPGGDPSAAGGPMDTDRAVLEQATGMTMAALELSAGSALSRLRATAFLQGRLVTDVAADVVAGVVPASLE